MSKLVSVSQIIPVGLLAVAGLAANAQTDQADPRHAVVLAIEGKAYAVADSGQGRPLKRGESLPAGASVRTDADGKVDL